MSFLVHEALFLYEITYAYHFNNEKGLISILRQPFFMKILRFCFYLLNIFFKFSIFILPILFIYCFTH
ncbi:hypothetical protein C4T25_05640 [Clostridioides difficile]|nr:hypothetical protein [Clostridioides difficile]EGT4543993.1 hypothetical protein [Clostridioides difficile]EGT4869764.1 hypothetical protein [Clostridioides difficile]EGT5229817.1 hypothetical protein [Clostridioides difficile]MDB0259182.1 hypothetical protein [Clostridioides difficile]